MKYKLAIFDMDGTILDTLQDLADAVNYALEQLGYPQRTLDEVRNFVGNGIKKLMERAVPEGTCERTVAEGISYFKEYYGKHCADNTKAYDGITDLLKNLQAAGMATAVVSNKADFAVHALCQQYFDGLFNAAVGEKESEGIRKKPAPDSVNMVLEELKTDRKDAVYIGDSDVDIETGRNAGMECISVSWGFRSRSFLTDHGATRIIDHVSDLQDYLLEK